MQVITDPSYSVFQSVYQGLRSAPRPDGKGQIVQILSAKTGSGVSYIARELALMSAEQAKIEGHRTALIDCDFAHLSQSRYFFSPNQAREMEGPYDASFGNPPFWFLRHANQTVSESASACNLYLHNPTGMAVTTIAWDNIDVSDRLDIRRNAQYWGALRSHFTFIFIDSPALDRSNAGLTFAPDCDGTILIAREADAESSIHNEARKNIIQQGGRYLGLLKNASTVARSDSPQMALF